MGEEARKTWISLQDAFQRVGMAIFHAKWNEQTILVGHSKLAEHPDASDGVPIRANYSLLDSGFPEDEEEFERRYGSRAISSRSMIEAFDEVSEALRDAVWRGGVSARCVSSDGEIETPPQKLLKDRDHDRTRFYFEDSFILHLVPSGDLMRWDVEILELDVVKLAKTFDQERRAKGRKAAANKNPKGGNPGKYDWETIEGYIETAIKQNEDGTPNTEVARTVVTAMEDKGIEAPDENQIRGHVATVRKRLSGS